MRLLYTVFLLIITAPSLFSQEIQFGPIMGNPVLRSHFNRQQLDLEERLERMTGIHPRSLDSDRDGDQCPPELPFNLFIVESGASLDIEIDTFGLAIDSTPPTITLLTDPPLLFGTATYADSTITLTYNANVGITGVVHDTILLHYFQAGGEVDLILEYPIVVKRLGVSVVADGVILDPEEEVSYCLDDELDLPGHVCCSFFVDCPDNYGGAGNEFKYFYNDTCIVYIASRFPGTDTVCIQVCDELAVCDVFKIPFTIVGDTLSISSDNPFFEDFSTSNGPYPSQDRWLDDDVFINTTFSKNPPSVGMATFDGLDRGGSPYDLVNGGIGDKLTSVPIDLSPFNASSNVYLRYFVSPKGYGQEPEIDPFYLEFLNNQGKWIGIDTIDGTGNIPLDSVPPFLFYAVKIDDPSFLHDAFQMRFSASTSPGGYGDWWHLDYIHLSNNSTDVNRFPDMAFTELPSNILAHYTSMPWAHFEDHAREELDSVFYSTVFNHENFNQDIEDSEIKISETTVPKVYGTTYSLSANSINVGQNDIGSQFFQQDTAEHSKYVKFFKDIPFDQFRNAKISYSLTVTAQGNEFFINDQVEQNVPFDDYFAHDDGSAELQFFWQQAQGGEETAVQYKTNVEDSLRGIQIMFPHFTFFEIESQLFNLKVWLGDANGPFKNVDPVYEMELVKPFFVDERYDTLQAFTTYKLEDLFGVATPLYLPADQYFYVGFEQLAATSLGIPIGYDLNNPCNCNFGKRLETWINFDNTSSPKGALMIRPVFGDVVSSINPTVESNNSNQQINIYPNPTIDQLNIDLETGQFEDYKYLILNQVGQMVQQGNLQSTIALDQLVDGAYYLQVVNKGTGEISIQKFIIAKN